MDVDYNLSVHSELMFCSVIPSVIDVLFVAVLLFLQNSLIPAFGSEEVDQPLVNIMAIIW